MAEENQENQAQAPTDIYPLGQGGGLMKDILNFALNNIYQYGEKLGKESERVSGGLERLRTGGQSGLSTSEFQPSIGPNVVGQITPANWAAYSPEAKAIVTEVFNKFPKMFERVQATKPSLHLSMQPRESMAVKNALGAQRNVNPFFDEIQLLQGPGGQRAPGLQGTAIHEFQHHVNAPRIAATDPADAGTIALLMRDLMYNKDIGSLQHRIGQMAENLTVPGAGNRMITGSGYVAPETISRLGTEKAASFAPRAAMDEAYAYLANYAPNDPDLARLAEKLDIGPGVSTGPSMASRLSQTPAAPSLMDEVWSSINQMRSKLSGISPDKPSAAGGGILQQLYDDRLATGKKLGVKDPINKDAFMQEMLSNLASLTSEGTRTPLSAFRRVIAPSENKFNMGVKPLDPTSTLDLLQHFKQYGLLEKPNLEKFINRGDQQVPYVDAQQLDRIKALLERVTGGKQ